MPGDVTAFLGSQEQHRIGDIGRLGEAAKRNLLDVLGTHLFLDLGHHRRLHHTGGHGIHRDAPPGQFLGQHPRDADDPCLCRGVVHLPGDAHQPGDRGDVHDAPGIPQNGCAVLAGVEHTGEVGVDHRIPFVRCHLPDGAILEDARVVHQDVQPAEPGLYRCKHGLHLHRIGHVRIEQFHLAGRKDSGYGVGIREVPAFRIVQVMQHAGGTGLHEPFEDLRPDAA